MRVLHASAFSDVHLCGVNTSGLEKERRQKHIIQVHTGDVKPYVAGISAIFYRERHRTWTEDEVGGYNLTCADRQMAYHRSVDIPEGSLLAVKDLPLSFVLFPVDPAEEISRRERSWGFSGIGIRCSRWIRTEG